MLMVKFTFVNKSRGLSATKTKVFIVLQVLKMDNKLSSIQSSVCEIIPIVFNYLVTTWVINAKTVILSS